MTATPSTVETEGVLRRLQFDATARWLDTFLADARQRQCVPRDYLYGAIAARLDLDESDRDRLRCIVDHICRPL